jgi:glucokinase
MADKIAVDFGGTSIRVALVSGRRVKSKVTIAAESKRGFRVTYKNLTETIKTLMSPHIKSINVGAPAPMDIDRGVILGPRNLKGWKKVPLREMLEREFKVQCRVDNDANCFALGEALFGAGRRHEVVAGIIIGTGLGMGVVINKSIRPGNSSAAGEIGIIPYKNKTLEDFCSSHFFKSNPKAIEDLARKGGKKAKKAYAEFGRNLAAALSVVITTIDPDIIILGGGLSNAFDIFKEPMMKELKKLVYPLSYSKVKIVKSKLKNAALLGAAELS